MSRPMRAARLRPRGLPQRLPPGERLLWQGSPSARALMFRVFHLRTLAVYFGLIVAWSTYAAWTSGAPEHAVMVGMAQRLGLAGVPLVLIAVYAWAIERSTIYSITSHRVVISFGIAVPVTFNIPFSRIEAAGLNVYPNGCGDIPLRLQASEKLSYLVMWPHARPWRTAHTEPMLRCIAGAADASRVLAEALSENAALADGQEQPHTAQPDPASRPVQRREPHPTQAVAA